MGGLRPRKGHEPHRVWEKVGGNLDGPLPGMKPAQHTAGTRAAPPHPALLTMLTGLEGAVPQQLLPAPQVHLVGIFSDHVICQHMAYAHCVPRTCFVLGDTFVDSANTDVTLGWACDPQAFPDTPQGTTGPSSFLVTLPQGPDLGTWDQSSCGVMGTMAWGPPPCCPQLLITSTMDFIHPCPQAWTLKASEREEPVAWKNL